MRIALLFLFPLATYAQVPQLSAAQQAKVAKGGVVLQPLSAKSGVKAWAVAKVEAPIAAVWPVVRDCEHFSKFMPRTKVSKKLRQEGNTIDCKVEISMPFPISNLWSHVRSVITEHPGGGWTRAWKLLKGNYKRNNGSWSVLPYQGDPNRSLLVYRIDVDPDIMVPDAIIRSAQTGSLPDVFVAVRKRVGAK